MKKYLFSLLVLAIVALPYTLTSCKNNEDETELTEECYISGVTLGSLYRSMYTKTSQGQDSIYTTTFAGSNFPMTINHRELTIENLDSLPTRTRLTAIPTTVTFQGSIYWRKSDGTEDSWATFNSGDSLDLTTPIYLRVYSHTGNSSRTYTLKLNRHQQNGDSTVWNQLGDVAELGNLAERKALVWDRKLTLLAKKSSSTLTCVQHPTATNGEWTSAATTGTEKAIPSTLQQWSNKLYMSTSDGHIIESTDALSWTPTSYPAMSGLTLVAASDDYLYALCDNKLYHSNGGAWEEEILDDNGDNLPVRDINSVCCTMKNGEKILVLVGQRISTDKTASVWAKVWGTEKETTSPWMYYAPNNADIYRCPLFTDLCILPYDGGLQALGGKTKDGSYTALGSILHSSDYGISWKSYDNNDMNVDPDLQTAARAAQYIAATVDDEQFLWIVTDTKVWRGRINRLGFKRQDR